MEPYILERTNWKQVKDQRYEVAVLPWGATEPHNYHLPYGTDSLETKRIACDSARIAWEQGAKVMVLPVIPLGIQNPGQSTLPFCLHTSPATQLSILKDIIHALYTQKIRKFVLLNGHGGNDFKGMIRELQFLFPDMFISLIEWFRILDLPGFFEEGGDHAGEMETSVILHYFPELVLPLEEAGDGKSNSFRLNGLNNKTAWAPRNWEKTTKDTGVGNPKKASAEKGKKYIEALTLKIGHYLVELATCNIDELYENNS